MPVETAEAAARQQAMRLLVGARLRAARQRRGLSLRDMNRVAGVSYSFLSAIELGRRGVSLDLLVQLADTLGVSVADLVDLR